MNNNGPLMFINNPDNLNNNELETGKKTYDSRHEKKDKILRISKREIGKDINEYKQDMEEKKISKVNTVNSSDTTINKFLLDKLNNICVLYSYDMPVLCEISYGNESIKGVPSFINGNNLYIYVKGNQVTINIDEINDFKILEL